MEAFGRQDPLLLARALEMLDYRLARWDGENAPALRRRFKNKVPEVVLAGALHVEADPAELLLVRAFALTTGAAQFGVTPQGAVFATDVDGYSRDPERRYLSGLSPLLDDAGDIVIYLKDGRGGRFFERDAGFFLADGRRTFMRVTSVRPAANVR